jgi:hypothetical protein
VCEQANKCLLQNGMAVDRAELTGEGMSDLGFIHAFVASLSVIIVSELGDKTFFIAAIMAMRHPRVTVFLGAIGALALMTVLSGKCHYCILVFCFLCQWLIVGMLCI